MVHGLHDHTVVLEPVDVLETRIGDKVPSDFVPHRFLLPMIGYGKAPQPIGVRGLENDARRRLLAVGLRIGERLPHVLGCGG